MVRSDTGEPNIFGHVLNPFRERVFIGSDGEQNPPL